MKFLFPCFLLIVSFSIPQIAYAQTLQAVVANKVSRQPIHDVFVFLANSSIGTASDENGIFKTSLRVATLLPSDYEPVK